LERVQGRTSAHAGDGGRAGDVAAALYEAHKCAEFLRMQMDAGILEIQLRDDPRRKMGPMAARRMCLLAYQPRGAGMSSG